MVKIVDSLIILIFNYLSVYQLQRYKKEVKFTTKLNLHLFFKDCRDKIAKNEVNTEGKV